MNKIIKTIILINLLLVVGCKENELKTVYYETPGKGKITTSNVSFSLFQHKKDSMLVTMDSDYLFKFTTKKLYEKVLAKTDERTSFFITAELEKDRFQSDKMFGRSDTLVIVEYDQDGKELLPYIVPMSELFSYCGD